MWRKMKDNRCPKCGKGFISCTYNGFLWIDECTDCHHRDAHINRRVEQMPIRFKDRRKQNE